MRTTVTLDPDVEALLKERMRERNLSFKQALNDAVRTALATGAKSQEQYELPTFKMGFRPDVPLVKALSVAESLEDEEIARKLSLRK